jgi:hypothetical protein
MSDNDDLSNRGKEKTKTDAALTEELSSEVFDSSTYDSMTDLKAPATMNNKNQELYILTLRQTHILLLPILL